MISFCCLSLRLIFRNFIMVKSPFFSHHLGKINKVERLLWFQSKQSMLCIWKSIWWDFKSVFCSFLPRRFLGNDPISSNFIPLPWTIVDFFPRRNFIQFERHICFNSEIFSTRMESIHPNPTFSDASTGSNRKLHTLGRFSDERGMSELLLPGEGLLEKGSGRNFVLQDLLVVLTLPETSIAPENRPSQKETHLPTPVFQVRTVSFREATSQKDGFLWTLDSRCELRVSKRINIDTAHFAIMSKKSHVIFATSYTVRAE